ncbi:nucleotide-binding universal stress UspA family protein [Sulfuritortus calidifontis]|uniref:Nucleotide-binding universal stress UspA family protein n=1 Tax=Sulfuritortus calidifontis TaxID=1914471 RepID=A0A4R3JXY5_9PROT|nr:universal stress protein [Sulfuritortus calidifontis]TCS71687.1 nucleotide-binding universal stress UspA family protein [Sulfuritortus calidifontis]
MKKILLPVDGSDNSLRAVQAAIDLARGAAEPPEIHLLNVQLPIISGDVKMFVSEEQIKAYYHDEGIKALAAARAALDAAGVAYVFHIGVGPVAETIAAYAKEKGCNQIIMGARGLGSLTGLLLGSVTTKVAHLVDVPVTLVK